MANVGGAAGGGGAGAGGEGAGGAQGGPPDPSSYFKLINGQFK